MKDEAMTQKVHTVNVIEFCSGCVDSIRSFTDNETGNREAEILFYDRIKEEYPKTLDEEIEVCIDDGCFEYGNYEILLLHSI